MTTGVACPAPVFRFCDSRGNSLVGGTVLTQVSGVNAATYQDVALTTPLPNPIVLNSRGEVSTAAGASAQLFLTPNTVYTFTVSDANGNQIWVASYVNGVQVSQASIALLLWPQTAAEFAASVVPTNYVYQPGDVRRYGGDPTNTADSSSAWQSAISLSAQTNGNVPAYIPGGCAFKILTGATYGGSNQVNVRGDGPSSQLWCDSTVLTCRGGASNSSIDNLALYNITAPWIITRNPANWAANISSTLQQSNSAGYQPTVNDTDIWSSLTVVQQDQQIGPTVIFSGSASDITVSRIFGRFVVVIIRDSVNSTIRDCDVRGGKGQWGTLQFDNWTNEVQRGSGNRAIDNRVQYGSFSGITFMANDDFTVEGNQSFLNGESGTKTVQVQGAQFTGSVGGAVAGTISIPVVGLADGTWTFIFDDNETRQVTVTGGTACAWAGALNATTILTASCYQGTVNPQCFRGQIVGNRVYQNYYDGLDCNSSSNTTVDAAPTYHIISQNYSYQNGGDGMNTDGRYNTIEGDVCYGNRSFGIWNSTSYSKIIGNHLIGNNTQNGSSISDLSGGTQGNVMSLNRIVFTATAGYPIYAAQDSTSVPHVIRDNTIVGGTAFYGNTSFRYPIIEDNVDATTGPFTVQSFCFFLENIAGTLEHVFYADGGAGTAAIADRISGESSGGFTVTPTGTDATTAFAAGAKISTTLTNAVVFNTGVQDAGNVQMCASVVYNTTGTPLIVRPRFASFDVNGVTQYRLVFEFYNAGTGAAFALTTANIGASDVIQVQFYGKLV